MRSRDPVLYGDPYKVSLRDSSCKCWVLLSENKVTLCGKKAVGYMLHPSVL